MPSPITKAMVLCAGLGTRLHPITHKLPKPIVEVLNVPNVLHIFFLLKRAGIKEVIVNLFHLSDTLENYFRAHPNLGISLSYSKEDPLLGTGGGLKKAEPFFRSEAFVLANCDFVTNTNLLPIIQKHQERKSTATMLLIQDEKRQSLYSRVGVDKEGYLCSLPKLQTQTPQKTGIFTGIHVLEPSIFAHLEEKPSGINEVLYPYLMQESPKSVCAEFEKSAYWYDTGDMSAICFASMELLRLISAGDAFLHEILVSYGAAYSQIKPGVWLEGKAKLPSDVQLVPPVIIGENCTFENSVRLGPYAVVGSNTHVGKNATISHSVVLKNSRVNPDSQLLNCLHFENQILPTKPLV